MNLHSKSLATRAQPQNCGINSHLQLYCGAMRKEPLEVTPGQPPPALVSALRKLLRPLVRLMMTYHITYPYLINLLKSTYVEVAERDFAMQDKRQSDSRITLLTGVHRKDVKRLRAEASHADTGVPRQISVGAQIIAHWVGVEPYSQNGKPVPLPMRTSARADEPTFDDLVEKVCRQDIRPRVILDEWIRLGVAQLNDQNQVMLNTGAFTPDHGFAEKAFFFGKNIHDHISAGTHNLLGCKPAHFDRSVYYDQLSEESVRELQLLASELGMKALTTLNRRALALQEADATELRDSSMSKQTLARYRINFGIFHYNDLIESAGDKPGPDDDDA